MKSNLFLTLASILLLISTVNADLLTSITPDYITPNNATSALFSSQFRSETPIALRFTLILNVAEYNVAALCHPRACNFWGVRQSAPPYMCSNRNARAKIYAFAVLRAIEIEFATSFTAWKKWMRQLKLNPDIQDMNPRYSVGLGNRLGKSVAAFFLDDGWNSLGNMSRGTNRIPFEDYTGYRPLNSPGYVRFPLKWIPLTKPAVSSPALLFTQNHIVPQLARLTPYTIPENVFYRKQLRSIYRNPYSRFVISWRDRRKILKSVRKLLDISKNLSVSQRNSAFFWENKFVSVGFIGPYYTDKFQLSNFKSRQFALGESLALYDGLLLAWKEKRRHDLVRPESLISNQLGNSRVYAYINSEKKVGWIPANEWEPLLKSQAHSEFPSASATLCRIAFEYSGEFLRSIKKRQDAPVFNVPKFVLPELSKSTTFRFRSLEDAARQCGYSRLWGGVHFEEAVTAGLNLGKGVGKLAHKHVQDLADGIIPKPCTRCL